MRMTVLVTVISLACSTSSAMWWPGSKPKPTPGLALVEKLQVAAFIAAGLYFLISDDGLIAYFTEQPRYRPTDED